MTFDQKNDYTITVTLVFLDNVNKVVNHSILEKTKLL